MGRCSLLSLALVVLLMGAVQAEMIGVDYFDYPNGNIAGKSGGLYWDWNNVTKAHTGTVSDWDNVFNTANVQNGKLVTSDSGARREYNGPTEGTASNPDTDERLGAFRAAGTVYYGVKMTQVVENPWCGFSGYDFGTERIFFGQPSGSTVFGIEISGGAKAFSTIPIVVGQTYHLVSAIDFDGDQLRLWVNPDGNDWDNGAADNSADVTLAYTGTNWNTSVRLASGAQTQWDDCMVATTFSELLPGVALNPSPANRQANVPLNVTLSWDPARDPANFAQADPAVKTHKLYANFAKPSDPNLYLITQIANTGQRASYAVSALNYSTRYSWRVVEVSDVNEVAGPVWSFTTMPPVPVITQNPASQTVAAGTTAVFTAQHLNGTDFQWYFNGTAINGAKSAELTIPNVSKANEGVYTCKISNGALPDGITTTPAYLWTKRLMAHWTFDNTLTDTVDGWTGVYSDPNGPMYVSDGISGQALSLDGSDGQYITVPGTEDVFNFYPLGMTAAAWVKTSSEGGIVSKEQDNTWNRGWAMTTGQTVGSYAYRSYGDLRGTSNVADDKWHLIVVSCEVQSNDRVLKVYADGVLQRQASFNGAVGLSTAPLMIGVQEPAGTFDYAGLIDEVSIWNYALTKEEIGHMYADLSGNSVCVAAVEYDLNNDCIVNLGDFAIIAQAWLNTNIIEPAH